MKKIQPNSNIASKFLNGIVTKVNAIIDKLIVDVKVNGESVVTVNEDGEREADIDLSLGDQNVKQSPTTDNKDYRVLLSKSDNDTEETDIARKNTNLKYNPSTGNLQATKLNGNTIPSGSGNDTLAKLSDIPTIPTVNDGKLTINQNGTLKGEFTANDSDDITVNLTDTTYTASGVVSIDANNNITSTAEVNQNTFAKVKVGSTTITADAKQDTLELVPSTNITLTPDATNDKVTIATTAEVNQNAFSNVKVGDTTVEADTKTDTLELVAGSNVTLTANATNDTITIASTDTNTHRPIKLNDTQILGNNTTALNLKNGNNISMTNDNGTVTINATGIPTVNDAKLTINQNSTLKGEFTANDSDDVTVNLTDENVKQIADTATSWRRLALVENNNTEKSSNVFKNSSFWCCTNPIGTTSTVGKSFLAVGNNTSSGTDGNSKGYLRIYGENNKRSQITINGSVTADREVYLPNKDGTIALTDDIPTVNDATLTINQNGTLKGTFTANQSGDGTTVNLTDTTYTVDTATGLSMSTNQISIVKVPIENGGTNATSRLGALKNLTNQNVASPNYVLGITTSWATGGYTSIANLKTTIGLNTDVPSGAIFTDEKVTQTNDTSGTEYPVILANGSTTPDTATVRKSNGLKYKPSTGELRIQRIHTATTNADSKIFLGNSIAAGTAGASRGYIEFYAMNGVWTRLIPSEATNNRTYFLPVDKTNNAVLATVNEIPTKTSQLTNDSNFVASTSLATVATSGSYNDLSNKPTIPSVYNKTLTIQKNGTNVQTFTANSNSDKTANITVPIGAFFGTCDTAAATAAKVVTLTSADGWELKAGVMIGVKFSITNTASSVTLNVNGSGARKIYFGNAEYTGSTGSITGAQNYVIYYMFDGTYWCFMNISNNWRDTNTWTANDATHAGYVANPSSAKNKFWKTNASGTPEWSDVFTGNVTTLGYFIGNHNMSSVDYTQANNGVSKNTYMGMFEGQDSDTNRLSRLETVVYTNGNIGIQLSVSNYNGTAGKNKTALNCTMDKSENLTYTLGDAVAFRKALSLEWVSFGSVKPNADRTLMNATYIDIHCKITTGYAGYSFYLPIVQITETVYAQGYGYTVGYYNTSTDNESLCLRFWKTGGKVHVRASDYTRNGTSTTMDAINMDVYYR